MNSINISIANTGEKMVMGRETLIITYLFAEKVFAAGDLFSLLQLEKTLKLMTIQQKADWMEIDPYYDDKPLDTISKMRELLKIRQQIKFADKELIQIMAATEKSLSRIFEITTENFVETMKQYGFYHFAPLLCNDGAVVQKFAQIGVIGGTRAQRKIEAIAEQYYQLIFSPTNFKQGNLLVQFLDYESVIESISSEETPPLQEDIIQDDGLTLLHQYCFSIPNIRGIGALELKTIRTQLKGVLQPFNAATKEWSALYADQSPSREVLIQFLSERIEPIVEQLKNIHVENELLNSFTVNQSLGIQLTHEIYLGHMPAFAVADYLSRCVISQPEIIPLVIQKLEQNKVANRLVPLILIMVKHNNQKTLENKIGNKEQKLLLKKTFSLDDD